MKNASTYFLFTVTFFVMCCTGELKGQNGFKIESYTTRFVNRVEGTFGDSWETKDTTKMKGLLITVKMFSSPTMGDFDTSKLSLEFEESGEKHSTLCAGIGLNANSEMELWMINQGSVTGSGDFFSKNPPKEEKVECISLLFTAPLSAKDYTLKYEDEVLIEKVTIK
jgi:hypothetical protein